MSGQLPVIEGGCFKNKHANKVTAGTPRTSICIQASIVIIVAAALSQFGLSTCVRVTCDSFKSAIWCNMVQYGAIASPLNLGLLSAAFNASLTLQYHFALPERSSSASRGKRTWKQNLRASPAENHWDVTKISKTSNQTAHISSLQVMQVQCCKSS